MYKYRSLQDAALSLVYQTLLPSLVIFLAQTKQMSQVRDCDAHKVS